MPVSHLERVALRKIEKAWGPIPEGFEFYHWRGLHGTDCYSLKGGVPRLLKRGPRKGQKTWDKSTTYEAIVTEQEVADERARWVEETGLCPRCLGTAKVFKSWNVKEGTKMQPCSECRATGKYIAPKEPAA
jgi:hypothetical protein